ncbi:MAG: SDR family oxidoreductase [Pseudomonadales bacterium]
MTDSTKIISTKLKGHASGQQRIAGQCEAVYFITGATGLMASEFVAQVLQSDPTAECILLIRASDQAKAEMKVDSLISYLFPDTSTCASYRTRAHAVIGDVSLSKMGLLEGDWEWVSQNTHYILHAAALTDWGADIEIATRVNINGVSEIINLAYACGSNLRKLLHISTAYVSADKTGTISPDELYEDCSPCDNYQLTKRQGEKIIRDHWTDLPVSIVRPATVVGNAQNGRTLSYKTFYYPLQLLYNGLPLTLPVNKNGNTESVPSDWAAQMMYAIINDKQCNSRCYHLTSGCDVLTNSKIKTIVYRTFAELGEAPKKTLYIPFLIYKLLVAPQIHKKIPNGADLDEKVRLYRHYMTYKRVFDNTATLELMEKNSIKLPLFEQYLSILLDYAISDKWERKRKTLQNLLKRAQKKAKTDGKPQKKVLSNS